MVSAGHKQFTLYEARWFGNHQTYGVKELCRVQVGENQPKFPGVESGVELGQVSYPS